MKKIIKLFCFICPIAISLTSIPVYADDPIPDIIVNDGSIGEGFDEVSGSNVSKVYEYDFSNNSIVERSIKSTMNSCTGDILATNSRGRRIAGEAEPPVNPNGIIGDDGRTRVSNTTDDPHCRIAFLRTIWKDGTASIGTAFMVGISQAATAGHCVYNAQKGGYAKQIDIWPGVNGSLNNSPYGKAGVCTIVIPKLYVTSNNRNLDAALISLDSAIGLETGYFGLRYQKANITTRLYVEGYPGDHVMQLWRMKGYILENNQYSLTYTIDTAGGQSGSPVYRSYNGSWYVVGIHTTGFKNSDGVIYKNGATRISLPIFAMMKQYILSLV